MPTEMSLKHRRVNFYYLVSLASPKAMHLPRQRSGLLLLAFAICTVASIQPLHAQGFGEAGEIRTVKAWGKKGAGPGEFSSPIGIAISSKDVVFVTDLNNSRVQKFSTDGKYLGEFDLPKDPPDHVRSSAAGIAIDEKGLIYISFMEQHVIRVYADDGKLIRGFASKGSGMGELLQPGGIVLAPDDTVLVADQGNHRVQRFTRDGKFVASWGAHGSKPGQFGGLEKAGSRFGGPHFLALDRKIQIYTTEGSELRVQRFSADGEAQKVWGDKEAFGAHKTVFSKNPLGPIAVIVDPHDRVWVSSLNDRVQAFTPDGRLLMEIGGNGSKPGEFWRPHGMAMDSCGHLYVADASNQRIQKFKVPYPRPPAERHRALLKQYNRVSGEFRKAESDLARKTAVENLGKFGPRFLNLALKYPDDPVALEAVRQAIQAGSSADSLALTAWEMNRTEFPRRDDDKTASEIVAFLLRDHGQSDKLGPLLDRMRYGYRLEYAVFLRAVLQENPHPEIQALACLSLAQNLNDRLGMLQLADDRSELEKRYAALFGTGYLAELRRRGADDLSEEIEILFERATQYDDVETAHAGPVAEQAKRALHEWRHLAVGKMAPEIEGTDADGRRFKLSDYRGKVVLLYFWSNY